MSSFVRAVLEADSAALHSRSIDTLMLNVGLRCDRFCSHCHQSSSASRSEMMSREVMDACISVANELQPQLIDITGGAPELHPDIHYLLTKLHNAGHRVRLRTNLTALLTPEAAGLVDLLVGQRVSVLASFPANSPEAADEPDSRVYARMREALSLLSAAGYGQDAGLRLDIAVNPDDDALCEPRDLVETRMRERITGQLGIVFDELLVITNMPVGRFKERLRREGRLGAYLHELRCSFNPDTLPLLACRSSLEVAWDGTLWDCDFNLAHGTPLAQGLPRDVRQFDAKLHVRRPVAFAEHCFGCTAAAGSG
jgi:radical SAM/Cys-rich protein